MSSQTDIKATTLKYAEVSGRALHLADQLLTEQSQKDAAAKSLIPNAVNDLIRSGLIGTGDEKIATDKLSSHSETLKVLGNIVAHYREKEAEAVKVASTSMGKGVSDTHSKPVNANFVGRRLGQGEKSAADEHLLRLIPGYSGS